MVFFPKFFAILQQNMIEKRKTSQNKSRFKFTGIFLNIPRNLFEHLPEPSKTFSDIFSNTPRDFREHFPEC